jgi:hypothetical protein
LAGIISNDTRVLVKSLKSQAQSLKEADARPSKKAKTSRENTTPAEDAHARRCLASFVAIGSKGLWKEKVPSQTKSAEAPSAAATPAIFLDHVPMAGASKPLTARASKMGPAAQPEQTVPMGLEASASSGSDVPFIISRNGEVATEQPGAPHSVDWVPEGRGKGVALDPPESSDSGEPAELPPTTQSGPRSPARWVEQLRHPMRVLEKVFPADCLAKRRGEPCKTISERLCGLLAQVRVYAYSGLSRLLFLSELTFSILRVLRLHWRQWLFAKSKTGTRMTYNPWASLRLHGQNSKIPKLNLMMLGPNLMRLQSSELSAAT